MILIKKIKGSCLFWNAFYFWEGSAPAACAAGLFYYVAFVQTIHTKMFKFKIRVFLSKLNNKIGTKWGKHYIIHSESD